LFLSTWIRTKRQMMTTLSWRREMLTWQTKDGREIRVRDMTDSHLLNTIHMIRRKVVAIQEETVKLYGLPLPQYTDLVDNNMWKSLNRERRRRGLCGIHTGDCIWVKSDNEDHSFVSRACYAKQREKK
jgi:hypothetical protein